MNYCHADVFSPTPFGGNGLAVVFPDAPLPDAALLGITREFRQYETIFLAPPTRPDVFPARIFTMDEELPFAGHPVLGAGAALHRLHYPDAHEAALAIALGDRLVPVRSRREQRHFRVTMNQGRAVFREPVAGHRRRDLAAALGLREDNIHPDLPIQSVSTGLAYLLVPLRNCLERCGIAHPDMGTFLSGLGAQFVYVFDAETLECRTWDNAGHAEDVATGSAAGPLCAYLVRHGLREAGGEIQVRQGRFCNRPSVIAGTVLPAERGGEVLVAGDVCFFASGEIFLPPTTPL